MIREVSKMSTMNISIPDSLRDHVEQKVKQGLYSTNSEYVKELIRKDLEREQLRGLIMDGINSPVGSVIDEKYLASLKRRVEG